MRPGTFTAIALGWLLLSASPARSASDDAIDAAAALEKSGDFAAAEAVLSRELAVPVPLDNPRRRRDRDRLEFELDRLPRIRRDYRLSRGAVWEALQKVMPDVRASEFDQWIREGCFDIRTIDGEERFFVSSVSNLFHRRPELESRRRPLRDNTALELAYWENAVAIRTAAQREGRPHVLPHHFEIRMRVEVLPATTTPGARVVAWMPIPRELPYQSGFNLLKSTPSALAIAPPMSPIRAICLEQSSADDGSATFEIAYEYTAWGVRFALDPQRSGPANAASPTLQPFLNEGPHVIFSPEMRALAGRVGGDETNAVRLARHYYEWIAANIRYSFAPEYSTVRNLAETCRASGRGDCGQATLLFMTLCRLSGIPARWQSGWAFFPGDKTIHDWCEIHLSPWGWVPVDPYMGVYATQYAKHLSANQRAELADFYFGGLNAYRMSANGDHNQLLIPAKTSMRSDDVDFQRGELEADGSNLFFDQFNYEFQWKEIPLR